jgi:hypothetical protein
MNINNTMHMPILDARTPSPSHGLQLKTRTKRRRGGGD